MIAAVVPNNKISFQKKTISNFKSGSLITQFFILAGDNNEFEIPGCELIKTVKFLSSETLRKVSEKLKTEYLLFLIEDTLIEFNQFGFERLITIAKPTGAGLLYSDFIEKNSGFKLHPLIDYQAGSIRYDFNFGPLLFLKTEAIKKCLTSDFKFADVYDLRLNITIELLKFRPGKN